ncbi:MAG: hypothetical protein CL608_21925 [Anaerolineaceae bacterium]|nr:hypothetical protein [Anaerolineaceae bacterium]
MGAQLHISLLGEFSLVFQGKPVSSLSGDRPISLLAYLLLHRQTAVSRQHLAFTLWPDSSDSQARANLRNLFYTLRQTLPDADTYLAGDSMTLQWRSDAPLELDVAEFEAALAAAQSAASDVEKQTWLETAVTLYKGDLLPDNYDDWIIPLRETLRHAYLDALHQLMHLLEEAGDYRAAARYGQRLLQSDPLDETAYVQLMRLHAFSGDRAGVRRLYETCVTTLRRELDVEPGPATQAAYEQLLRLEAPAPSLELEGRPAASQLRPLPLPVPATTFIGREAELAHVAELLAEPTCRLLTIVGPGGIGKTRLALQTAEGHRPIFADGVTWVALTGMQTPDHLATAIAEALNYRLRGSTNAELELIPLLAAKELLLVLDNFEHLLPAADFLTRLLSQTTAVKLLITSRQPLELQEEWRFDLGELALPDTLTAESLAQNSAVQLFVQSARRVSTAFTPTDNDFPIIVRICQQVDGMPLGIELAASWTRLLSCAEIAAEIEKDLDFLAVSLRNVPPRHRSLRAVFDHSWQMLTPDEQQILLRLSIFQGGFTREAAAQVAAANLPQLSALVDRSLVQRTAVGRYSLHNVIGQYAAERLQANAAAYTETSEHHSRYFLSWLAEQDAALRGAGQKEGLTAVATDLANIRTAWQWAVAQLQTELLLLAAFPLFYFFELRGLLAEGEAAFSLAAEKMAPAVAADHQTETAVCAMQIYQAYQGFRQGKLAAAETVLRQAVDQLHSLTANTFLSHGLCYLGLVEWSLGHFAAAVACLEKSFSLATEQQDRWGIGTAQVYLGMILHDQGRLDEARQQLTAVQPTLKQVGDPRLMANAWLISGRINLLLGHLSEAEQQLLACLETTRETNDPNSITYATHYLGMVKQAQGDLTAARQFIEQSITLFTRFNDLVGRERALVTMGFLEIECGNLEAAHDHFLTFLRTKERIHSVRYILAAVVGTAVLQARSGDPFTALVWTLSVLQHPGVDWEARQRAEALRPSLEAALSPEQITCAQQQAANQSFAAILAHVLNQ